MRYLENNASRIIIIAGAFLLGSITPIILLFIPVISEGEITNIGSAYPHHVDFNENLWDEVQIGMSETKVISLIGEPYSLKQSTSQDKKTLVYINSHSQYPNYVHYYIIIQNGKVLEKKEEILKDQL